MPTSTELINPVRVLEVAGIREAMQVADLGCGALGHFVFPAARLVGKSGRVYAVDIQKNVLEAVRGRLLLHGAENVELVWGDIERRRGVGIPDATLDIALVVNNLFLARDPVALGKETLRMLKQGGVLVVVDWKSTGIPFGPALQTRVAPADARRAMEQAGFRFRDTFAPGEYHYGLVFDKP